MANLVSRKDKKVSSELDQIEALGSLDSNGNLINLATEETLILLADAGFGIPSYDYVSFGYTGTNITSIIYKTSGSSGTTVTTLTIAYDVNGNITSITKL